VAANRLQATTPLGEQAHDVAAWVGIATEAGCQIATLDGERPQSSGNAATNSDCLHAMGEKMKSWVC
jgi:fructose-1,6-bisphosphatase/inositol monophosphatase family enzyme